MNRLSKEQLEVISKTVIKEHNKASQRVRKEKRDWRLRNTALLLKNHRLLSKHCEGIVADLEVYREMVFDPNGLKLDTLMQYKAKTAKIMLYFNTTYGTYRDYAKTGGEACYRRFKILDSLYVNGDKPTIVELAERYNVDKRTVHRDINKAIDELSVLLFGFDSLSELSDDGH